MSNKFLIIGTGAWGTAIASILLNNNQHVKMYGISDNQINDLRKGCNNKVFDGCKLKKIPQEISSDLKTLFNDVKYVIFCIPSKSYNSVIKKTSKYIKPNMILINTSKSLTEKTNYHEVLKMNFKKNKVYSIIGPSFAKEVLLQKHTAINIVGDDKKTCNDLIKKFNNDYFKLIYANDYVGIILLSALKNILAIIMGILDSQKISINTKAAILTFIINNFKKIIKLFGGNEESITQLAGIGDIFLTCTDSLSRNYSYGFNLTKFNKNSNITIEGYWTINNLYKYLYNRKKIKNFWLIELVYKLINKKIDVELFIENIWKKI